MLAVTYLPIAIISPSGQGGEITDSWWYLSWNTENKEAIGVIQKRSFTSFQKPMKKLLGSAMVTPKHEIVCDSLGAASLSHQPNR